MFMKKIVSTAQAPSPRLLSHFIRTDNDYFSAIAGYCMNIHFEARGVFYKLYQLLKIQEESGINFSTTTWKAFIPFVTALNEHYKSLDTTNPDIEQIKADLTALTIHLPSVSEAIQCNSIYTPFHTEFSKAIEDIHSEFLSVVTFFLSDNLHTPITIQPIEEKLAQIKAYTEAIQPAYKGVISDTESQRKIKSPVLEVFENVVKVTKGKPSLTDLLIALKTFKEKSSLELSKNIEKTSQEELDLYGKIWIDLELEDGRASKLNFQELRTRILALNSSKEAGTVRQSLEHQTNKTTDTIRRKINNEKIWKQIEQLVLSINTLQDLIDQLEHKDISATALADIHKLYNLNPQNTPYTYNSHWPQLGHHWQDVLTLGLGLEQENFGTSFLTALSNKQKCLQTRWKELHQPYEDKVAAMSWGEWAYYELAGTMRLFKEYSSGYPSLLLQETNIGMTLGTEGINGISKAEVISPKKRYDIQPLIDASVVAGFIWKYPSYFVASLPLTAANVVEKALHRHIFSEAGMYLGKELATLLGKDYHRQLDWENAGKTFGKALEDISIMMAASIFWNFYQQEPLNIASQTIFHTFSYTLVHLLSWGVQQSEVSHPLAMAALGMATSYLFYKGNEAIAKGVGVLEATEAYKQVLQPLNDAYITTHQKGQLEPTCKQAFGTLNERKFLQMAKVFHPDANPHSSTEEEFRFLSECLKMARGKKFAFDPQFQTLAPQIATQLKGGPI
jgi:hypothetical protein